MGRLWLAICAVLLCSSVAFAGYSTNKKELERAAELAVERAAEKAAERAVEKALNSGNSSTITVTVKEAYENTKKTAEEAAAPGSESTRTYDPKMYDRQYAYQPPADGEYKVSDSAEAEELGISQESLNSSVEDLGSAEVAEGSAEGEPEDVEEPVELTSFESVRETGDKTTESTTKDFDLSLGLEFGLDFGSLDMSGDFGSKSSSTSNTKTYSSSYSKPKNDYPETKVDVNDEEDAEIFGMYASDFDGSGWSSTKQEGWVRHRPLWDDTKSRVSRGSFWDDFTRSKSDEGDEKKREKKSSDKPKTKLFKRMAEDYEAAASTNQVAVPLASLSLDPKAPALLYQLLQKELKYSTNNYSSRSPIPMRLYVTVPVPYLRANNNQRNDKEVTHITPRAYQPAIAPKQINDEMDDQGTAATKQPSKRSHNFGRRMYVPIRSRSTNFDKNNKSPRGRTHRSVAKVIDHKVELKNSTTIPVQEFNSTTNPVQEFNSTTNRGQLKRKS